MDESRYQSHASASGIPPFAGYDSYSLGSDPYEHNSPGQLFASVMSSNLQSQICNLENQLAERKKEITEARSVISYLLKLNTAAASNHGSTGYCKPEGHNGSNEVSRCIAGDVKKLLSALVDILQGQSSRSITNDVKYPSVDDGRKPACGDLLDMSDEYLGLESLLPTGEEIPPKQGKCTLSEPFSCSQSVKYPKDDRNQFRNTPEACQDVDVQALEFDDFPFPYVTRFARAQSQASKRSADDQRLNALRTSFTASSIDLTGSTRYETSTSTGVTSLNSSFACSDDGAEYQIPGVQKEQHRQVEDGKGKTKPTPASLPLLERCGATTSAIPSTLAVAASPRLAPKPLSSTAQLFTPKWPANSLGVSIREREAAVFVHKRVAGAQELQFPDLFRYGIRFRPEVNETDIYRTVLVDNLPPKMTLFPLLQRVKGGLVLDAKMLNTIRVTGSMSAIITFVHDFGARAFIDGVSRQPLVFGTHHRARVTLLPTPTYPISKSLRAAIVTHGHTRCLEIRNFPRGITPAALERDLRVCDTMSTHRIEAKRMRDDGVLEMRFTSVGYAGRAYGILTSRVRYRGCGVVFSRDPCARAWEAVTTLLPHNPPASTEIDSKPEIRTTDYAEEAKDEDCTGRLNDVVFDDEPSEVQRGRGFGYDEALATANNNTCSPQ